MPIRTQFYKRLLAVLVSLSVSSFLSSALAEEITAPPEISAPMATPGLTNTEVPVVVTPAADPDIDPIVKTPEAEPTPLLSQAPNKAATDARADYRRKIIKEGGVIYYVVGPRAPHLFMISRDIYGDESRWHDIADWNRIKPPYTLTVGQRLILKSATTLTDEQANRLLIAAWTKKKASETVEYITLSEKTDLAVVVPVASPSPSPEPEFEAIPVLLPSPPPSPTPAVIVPPPVASPAPVAAPLATPEEKEVVIDESPQPTHEKAAAEHESRWHFSIAPFLSLSTLHSDFATDRITNTFISDLDYGVEAEVGFHFSENNEVTIGAGVEHLDVASVVEQSEVEANSQNLAHFELGLHHQFNHVTGVRIAAIDDEEAFVEPTTVGAELVPIYIPQVLAGVDFWLIRHPTFGMNLGMNGLVLLPTKKDDFDLQTGYGGLVSLNFGNNFKSGKLIYGVTGRYLMQNATGIKTWQTLGLVKIGWEF